MTEPTTDSKHAHDSPGLYPRSTSAADAVARVDAGEHPPSGLWRAVATSEGFQRALVEAVRELLADASGMRWTILYDAGVTAADGAYARAATGLDRAPETDAHREALELTAQFGQDGMTSVGHVGLEEIVDGPLALLQAADRVPTVDVRVGEAFRDRRRDQRERICWLLGALANACQVVVWGSDYTLGWLARAHRDDLPRSFSERCNAGRRDGSPVDEVVKAARQEFDPDGGAVRILRNLAAEPAETLPYHALKTTLDVSEGRVSQLTTALDEAGLVEKYGSRGDKQVDLLQPGSAFLEEIDEEIGRQQQLDSVFRNSGQNSQQGRVTPRTGEAPQEGNPPAEAGSGAPDQPYRTRYANCPHHAAAAAAAGDGGITAVEAPLPEGGDTDTRRTHLVSYDPDRDEALVSVRATTPLQYMTSVATSLASPRLLDKALPVARLEELEDPPRILRDARCIGGLSAEAEEDGEALRDRLVKWGEDVADMTTALRRGEYEDRARFCGEILRSAHGLAGTVTHLLDAAGVDVVRELRVPGGLADADLAALAETVSVATAIQSRYGQYAAYRQLYENREEKRETALSPQIDAADPLGEYIGGLVLRGPNADRLGQHVEGRLRGGRDVHEDAPEFAVRVPVTAPDRSTYAAAVARMGDEKGIDLTSRAVTLFRTLAADVYAATEAMHWLGQEDRRRDIRLDEVRVALASLPADRLLGEAPPTAQRALQALLRTETALSQRELADAADVSTRSLRRHLDALEALDLVRDTEAGYRLSLPTSEERDATICPAPVADTHAATQDVVFDLALTLVDDPRRLGDPEDLVGRQFVSGEYDWRELHRWLSRLSPWVDVARCICDAPEKAAAPVTFGADLEQASLTAESPPGGVA